MCVYVHFRVDFVSVGNSVRNINIHCSGGHFKLSGG